MDKEKRPPMTQLDAGSGSAGAAARRKPPSLKETLKTPWRGLRPDLILHPGPLDHDGQRSWVLEDPVRGNNYRLGFIEGELVYRLTIEPDLDKAVAHLYATTGLRPPPAEILRFIHMLQRESLAVLPNEEAVRRDVDMADMAVPPFIRKLVQGTIFFRVPLIRPDRFLSRTLPWVSGLWSPAARWFYLFCGLVGLVMTLQEIEIYLGTVSYLFTPQGMAAFAVSLALLKIGHEFAHAYTAKAMGLHVRSMGVFFIVFWPLLYTDTTDAWKIPDRRRRMRIAAAGVVFEMVVAGIALLLWAVLPDGILRSLMFFLSGTSLISSIFINLNPFMRYDGYYLLMDWWGIDNLRPRSFAMLRHAVRRGLLGWTEPPPEIHPSRRAMIVYGFLALLYRLFIGITIALAVYYLFFPMLGLMVFAVEIWIFLLHPGWREVRSVVRNRRYIGSRSRVAATLAAAVLLAALLIVPLPRFRHLPGLLIHREAVRVEAPADGRLAMEIPEPGREVATGDLLCRVESDALLHERRTVDYDLEGVKSSIAALGGGGEQGAYRSFLLAEEQRLRAVADKLTEAAALMEIRSPLDGAVTEINDRLYQGAFVAKGTYLFTVARPEERELRTFVHESLTDRMDPLDADGVRVRFPQPGMPRLTATFRERSRFPVHYLPNESLLDIAGGPILSVEDTQGRRPRDAYFAYTFDIKGRSDAVLPHGLPAWIWLRSEPRSVLGQAVGGLWRHVLERGLL